MLASPGRLHESGMMVCMMRGRVARGRRREELKGWRALRQGGLPQGLAMLAETVGTVVGLAGVLVNPAAPSFMPFGSDPISMPQRKLRVSWRRARKLATVTDFPKSPWSEHRVGVAVSGSWRHRYVAVRPAAGDAFDVFLASFWSLGGRCRVIHAVMGKTLEESSRRGDIRWLPVGIHADAITRHRFRSAYSSPDR
jgi:hypothetical protein